MTCGGVDQNVVDSRSEGIQERAAPINKVVDMSVASGLREPSWPSACCALPWLRLCRTPRSVCTGVRTVAVTSSVRERANRMTSMRRHPKRTKTRQPFSQHH